MSEKEITRAEQERYDLETIARHEALMGRYRQQSLLPNGDHSGVHAANLGDMAMNTQKVLAVRTCKSIGGYPYYAIAEYEAQPRKRDGVPTWRFVADIREYRRSYAKARKELPVVSAERGLPYLQTARHGVPCWPHID